MAKMTIPPHVNISREDVIEIINIFLQSGGLKKVTIGTDPGFPEHLVYPRNEYDVSGAAITRVPYMMLCLEGKMDCAVNKNGTAVHFDLLPGEAVFLCSNTWAFSNIKSVCTYFRMTIDSDHILIGREQRIGKIGTDGTISDATPRLFFFPYLPGPHTVSLLQRIEQIDSEIAATVWPRYAVGLLLSDILLLMKKGIQTTAGKAHATWLAIVNYLEQNCHLPLDRNNVATAFSITPTHVSRLFGTFSDAGFSKILEKLRIERSVNLLKTHNLNVSEVAYQCGFSSVQYFVRVFKQHYNYSPSKFKEALLLDKAVNQGG